MFTLIQSAGIKVNHRLIIMIKWEVLIQIFKMSDSESGLRLKQEVIWML